jgi:hypothetical protein
MAANVFYVLVLLLRLVEAENERRLSSALAMWIGKKSKIYVISILISF